MPGLLTRVAPAPSAGRSAEMIRMLAAAGKMPKVAMSGVSMLPLLREPMTLALGPARDLRVGDVVAYVHRETIVAHRVVGFLPGGIQTSGDAFPHVADAIDRADVIGLVAAVFADDKPDARRIDSWWFRIRGHWMAQSRDTRCTLMRLRRIVRAATPWRRPRAFGALVESLSAVEQRDRARLLRAIAAVDPSALAATAARHRCAGLLADGVRRLAVEHSALDGLSAALQAAGRAAVARSFVLRERINNVCEALTKSGVDFALLKGAARLYSGEAGAELHWSDDIDVLVKRTDLDAAAAAIQAAGYRERAGAVQSARYRAHHHHAAPLYPLGGGPPVELHVFLARPGATSLALDWNSLAAHFQRVVGPAGPVRCLGPVAAATHLAVHSIGLPRLRDVMVLARLLRANERSFAGELSAAIHNERTDPVRLQASVLMAARIAGVQCSASRAADRYLEWVSRREDLPRYLRRRSQLIEAWYGAGCQPKRINWAILAPYPRVDRISIWRLRWRAAGRTISGCCAWLFAAMLRPDKRA